MKTIKKGLLACMLLAVATVSAQEGVELFSVPLSSPNEQGKLKLSQIAGSITVIGYEGKEVIVKAVMGKRKSRSKESKNGMKRIDNSSMAISAEERDNVVWIMNEQHNRKTDMEIKVPMNFDLQLATVNRGDILVENVKGEMEISNVNGEITLKNVSGSASADTTNGDIKVDFGAITPNTSMAFSSFNGDIDITFPKSLKANIKLRSDMGEIFTDFDIVVDPIKATFETNKSSGTYKVKMEQWVKGKVNGGGPEMLFKTWQGDVMIRAN